MTLTTDPPLAQMMINTTLNANTPASKVITSKGIEPESANSIDCGLEQRQSAKVGD